MEFKEHGVKVLVSLGSKAGFTTYCYDCSYVINSHVALFFINEKGILLPSFKIMTAVSDVIGFQTQNRCSVDDFSIK